MPMLEQDNGTKWAIGLAAAAIIFVVLAWITYPLLLSFAFSTRDVTNAAKLAQFGDSFGALNALFSGLAVFGVSLSLILQGREIASNRRELRRQRDLLALQQFEGTLFNLLNLHSSSTNSLELQPRLGQIIRGKGVFQHLYEGLVGGKYLIEIGEDHAANLSNAQTYLLLFASNSGILRQHIEALRQICRFVNRSAPRSTHEYGGYIRSSISPHEAVLLLLHCLAHPNDKELSDHVCAFGLLENIQDPSLLENEEIRSFPAQAFGTNEVYARAAEGSV
ncbi:putative phage abortive infection protein [Paucibacter sp. XJ19-41]|uniref:putative phage abortive infection protein n=1 Tax=Paucibacter sp. XJ19-41 TaxID=2927824 RepID=UPI0023495956|nr:putative phage abortive infection protein [Paucibacter sp. XJ19-41]MDC6167431.1 putative phage abortive infection protein [Paucibacter sp. XJ19-41]